MSTSIGKHIWWREACCLIAFFLFVVHFIWLSFNLHCINVSSSNINSNNNNCESYSRFTEVYKSFSDYAGVYLSEPHTKDGFYRWMHLGLCIYQFVQNAKLLFGVIVKSPRLLESWLIYDVMIASLALLRFLREFYSKDNDPTNLTDNSKWFWNEFFPKFAVFFVINAVEIFTVHELWHYFVEERSAGRRSYDIRRFQCFSNQSWMTFMSCGNRFLRIIVFLGTVMMVGVQWSHMRSFGAEEFKLWAMLILSSLAGVNAFPWHGCVPNDPEVLLRWMKREVMVCALTYLLHISEAFEDMDFDFLVLTFLANEFVMVYAIFAAKEHLISPHS